VKPQGQIRLTTEFEQFDRDEAKCGAFASSSEYARTLVRERYLKESERAARFEALDTALARGIADAEAGRVAPLDEAVRRLRADLKLSGEGA
jgi:antitoxin ParD1/3/4